MSDAPVTRLDLDAIAARAERSKAGHDDWMGVSPGDRRAADRDSARDVPALLAALAAERARADQASPQMTVDQFREAVGVERASHAARGYDEAHDRTHGVPHLLRWALDYASRGEAVKSGALIVAALHLSEALEREERAVRARADQAESAAQGSLNERAIEAAQGVIQAHYRRAKAAEARADQAEQRIVDAPHGDDCPTVWDGPEHRDECACWKSAAPTAEQGADQ